MYSIFPKDLTETEEHFYQSVMSADMDLESFHQKLFAEYQVSMHANTISFCNCVGRSSNPAGFRKLLSICLQS